MKLKKRLPALFLALLLAFSPFLMAFPVSASSDVLTGSSALAPGYYVDPVGSPDGLPLAYFDGVEVSQLGLPIIIGNSFGVTGLNVYTTPIVSVSVEQNDWSPNYTKVTIVFESDYKGYRAILIDGVWEMGDPIDASVDVLTFNAFPGQYAYLNLPSNVVPDNWYFHEATVSLGSSGGPGVLSVFDTLISSVPEFLNSFIYLFVSPSTGLTTLGVLSLSSVFLGIFLLLMSLLLKFLRFR